MHKNFALTLIRKDRLRTLFPSRLGILEIILFIKTIEIRYLYFNNSTSIHTIQLFWIRLHSRGKALMLSDFMWVSKEILDYHFVVLRQKSEVLFFVWFHLNKIKNFWKSGRLEFMHIYKISLEDDINIWKPTLFSFLL